MGLLFQGKTDIGRKRKTNQDSIFSGQELAFFMVADGMGGHQGGDIASKLAVEYVPQYLTQNPEHKNDPKIIVEAVKYANQKIFEMSDETPELKGMGTTIVGLYFVGETLYVANVGDSRAYIVTKNNLYQMSKDHSLVQEKMNLGIYTREEAKNDQQKNVLVRTVGFEPMVEVDVFSYTVNKNDLFLICSDGLHGKVSDQDILHIITKCIPEPETATQEQVDQAVTELINQANANGGQDNISVIIVIAN